MKLLRLSGLNFFVMGSTFFFVSTSIRNATDFAASKFILFSVALTCASLLSDGGLTNLAFRQALNNSSKSLEIYANLLRNRAKRILSIQILACFYFLLLDIGITSWLMFLVISSITVLYSIHLSLLQSQEKYRSVSLIQVLNSLGFIMSSLLLLKTENLNITMIVVYLIFAWVPAFLYSIPTAFQLLRTKSNYLEISKDRTDFAKILYANVITMNLNQIALGANSSNLLTIYTVSSMPLTMLMPFSAALSTITSHKFKNQQISVSHNELKRLLFLLPFVLLLGVITLPILSKILGVLFGQSYVYGEIILIQICSAAVGLFTGMYGNLFTVMTLSHLNKRIAYAQALTVVVFGTIAGLYELIVLVALVDLSARTIGLFMAVRTSNFVKEI